ncbi:MAG: hypothetical protein IJ709_04455 [Selenomonas sp.]|nr:hypothetical protein [Selenomonas sp.]
MNNKVKFMGAQPPKCEKLPNGGTRFYYNVKEGEPFVNPTQKEDGSEGDPEILPTWNARYADVAGEVTRDSLITAIIRHGADYTKDGEDVSAPGLTIDDELAIQRQRDTKVAEFNSYNDFAEACKDIADALLAKEVES